MDPRSRVWETLLYCNQFYAAKSLPKRNSPLLTEEMRHPSQLRHRHVPSQTNPYHILNSKSLKITSNILLTLTPRFFVIFSFSGKTVCSSVIGVTWLRRGARGPSGGQEGTSGAGGKRGQKSLQCCFYLRNYFCYWGGVVVKALRY